MNAEIILCLRAVSDKNGKGGKDLVEQGRKRKQVYPFGYPSSYAGLVWLTEGSQETPMSGFRAWAFRR